MLWAYNIVMKEHKIIEKIKEKFCLSDIEVKLNLVVHKHKNGEIIVGLTLDNHQQDKCFYLFSVKPNEEHNSNENFELKPIAHIKFIPSKNSIFIRKLEYINWTYKGKGYASQMIKCFEQYCKNNNYAEIIGELIPLYDEPLEKVENYYKRNGFEIKEDTNSSQKLIRKTLEQTEENIF